MLFQFAEYPTRRDFVAAMERPATVIVRDPSRGNVSVGIVSAAGCCEGKMIVIAGPKNPYSWTAIVRIRDGKIGVYQSNSGPQGKPLIEAAI